MRVSDFDFDLPAERIALRPARPRDAARLLVVEPEQLSDRMVRDLPDLLKAGDVLVFNDTKVIPAALSGRRVGRGVEPEIDVLLHRRLDASRWLAFAKPGKRLRSGDSIRFGSETRVCL
ncbi:MAG: S-adenosylmethionine:tRNA ribosyltransferase-isomerase, partial [Rhizobiales bacterium]|nr:S-adenosylmethionine:tRNA ribosyltransferase-isomerase [Hyphomicrobiales bacterium]